MNHRAAQRGGMSTARVPAGAALDAEAPCPCGWPLPPLPARHATAPVVVVVVIVAAPYRPVAAAGAPGLADQPDRPWWLAPRY